MDDSHNGGSAPRKTLHTKRSFANNAKHSSQLAVDSPLYDASEEDNTDDGSIGMPWGRQPNNGASSLIQGRLGKSKAGASGSSRLASHNLVAESDSGIDSPTYDGDVESSTTVKEYSTGTVAGFPTSPISSIYPDPPSSSSDSTISNDDNISSVSGSSGATGASHSELPPPSVFLIPASGHPHKVTPKASDIDLPPTNTTNAPADVNQDRDEQVNTSMLSAEDIRAFVDKAIAGEVTRKYKINPPPEGRPIRIYADGVYDMFHFGHALQLRQAKLSFPSVHLLVGVCSDELCQALKARTVLSHFERLESARHCRWVDEVVPEAPWIIDAEFLDRFQIDYVAHDEDPYAGYEGSEDIYGLVKDLGKFLPTRRTPGISTSELIERLVVRYRVGDFDGKLEKIGHGELSARGSQYDDSRPNSRPPSRQGLALPRMTSTSPLKTES